MKLVLILALTALFFGFSKFDYENSFLYSQQLKHNHNKVAYFASGCFWCVEHIYESVKGVEKVISGYSGGTAKDANYKAVSSGKTNHAETVAVYYDSTKIDYQTLLVVFFASHDPSTLNQQGPDKGRH